MTIFVLEGPMETGELIVKEASRSGFLLNQLKKEIHC